MPEYWISRDRIVEYQTRITADTPKQALAIATQLNPSDMTIVECTSEWNDKPFLSGPEEWENSMDRYQQIQLNLLIDAIHTELAPEGITPDQIRIWAEQDPEFALTCEDPLNAFIEALEADLTDDDILFE